jgi:hypothetical protein
VLREISHGFLVFGRFEKMGGSRKKVLLRVIFS